VVKAIRWIGAVSVWLILAGCGNGGLRAQRFSFEAFAGSAYNFPTPLTVSQTGHPDIHLTARYDTKPFGPYYPYYAWRASFWNAERTRAWEFTQVHHRLFLTNNPPEIQTFAIHFGYNFFMVGHAWKRGKFVYHLDGGVLICNPESTVRGQTLKTKGTGILDAGYILAGGGAQVGVSRTLDITRQVFVVGNLAFMAGRAKVPVVDGSATVPNLGVHGQIGAGVRF
jgi:hypothetical protein